MAEPKKIGGEIGEVRASIDVATLNEYIEKHVPAIRVPVVVKQFKVRVQRHRGRMLLTYLPSLARYVVCYRLRSNGVLTRLAVKPNVLSHRCFVRPYMTSVPNYIRISFYA